MKYNLENTPAPWRLDNCNVFCPGQPDRLIAVVYGTDANGGNDKKQQKANAQAIAAVPDMLDALLDIADNSTDEAARRTAEWALKTAGV